MTCQLLCVVPLRSSTFCELYCRPSQALEVPWAETKELRSVLVISASAERRVQWKVAMLGSPLSWGLHISTFRDLFFLSILGIRPFNYSSVGTTIWLLDIAGVSPGLDIPRQRIVWCKKQVWRFPIRIAQVFGWRPVACKEHSIFGPETLRAVLSVAMLWSDCGVWASDIWKECWRSEACFKPPSFALLCGQDLSRLCFGDRRVAEEN